VKVDSRETLIPILQALWDGGMELQLQEYIPLEYDVRTLVLNHEILVSTRRDKVEGDFRTNLALGATTSPYPLDNEEKRIVLQAAQCFSGVLVGIDHIKTPKGSYILEINGMPGFRSNFLLQDSQTEINGEELIDLIITKLVEIK
jgi:ribosomal protein S6--L-glutamate ligase